MNHIPVVRGHMTNLTINLIFISVFYLFLGGFVSYCLAIVFPKFDKEWEERPNWQQLVDVSTEITVIILIAFWLTYFVNTWIPILKVSTPLEHYLESFGAQTIFIYAVFIFLGKLDDKLIHVFKDIFGDI